MAGLRPSRGSDTLSGFAGADIHPVTGWTALIESVPQKTAMWSANTPGMVGFQSWEPPMFVLSAPYFHDESAFKAKLAQIVRQKPKADAPEPPEDGE